MHKLKICTLVIVLTPWLAGAQSPIGSVAELLGLTSAERAEARPVKLQGVVVSVLPGGQVFSLHGDAHGTMVYGALAAGGVAIGDSVEVEGVTTGNRNARVLANHIEIAPLPAELPAPTALGEELPFGTRPLGEWVELAGTIVRLEKYDVGWFVELARAGGAAYFVIPRRGRSVTDEFNGATVQVRGIVLPLDLLARPEERPGLWVDNWSRVEILKPVAPPAEPVTTTALLTGRLEGRRVELDGVVRRVTPDGGTVRVTVARADRRFDAVLPPGSATPTNLVDARVTIRGTVSSRLNLKGQSIGIDLRLTEAADLEVTEAAPTRPHDGPATPIGEIGKPGAKAPHTRRLRVEGTVILNWPDRIFVEDATGSIEARLSRGMEVSTGELVSVLGFKSLAATRPVLVDAELLATGDAPPPVPVPATVPLRRMAGEAAGRLVAVEGRLVARIDGGRHHSLLLTASALGFRAVLPAVRGALPSLQNGSKLRVVGVCDPLSGHEGVTEAFELLLRSPADVTVLAAPSWWTPERSLAVVALLLGGGLGALGLIGRLRGQVRRGRAEIATMLDASPVALTIVHGVEGRVMEANEAFLRQFGFQRGEVTNRLVVELSIWAEPGDFQNLLRRCHERGAVRGLEARLRNSGGNLMHVLVTGELMRGTDGARVMLVFQDVTERESLRDQLRESQKMEAIGQLAAGVAHDFNNLLTVITGNSNMIADEVASDSEVAELNSELAEAAERAAGLTRQLQAFGRKQFVRLRAKDLNELVGESARLLRRLVDEHVEVRTHLEAGPVCASVDTGMLDQLLMNLAVNARDAMPEGGTFQITVREVEFSARGSQRWMEGETRRFAQITASDTGCGMPPEVLERVFEPFFSTKDVGKGTGLGLSTVYGIVKQHQGWIEAESEVGHGARFMVYLPLAGQCVEETETEQAPPRTGNGEHVLVAEDQPGLRRMIERTLTRKGYRVSITDSGDEARALWLRKSSGYDLLLTDIVMPGGLSGWELARVCRQDVPELRVLFMSGYADLDERGMKGMEVGNNLLSKPFSPEDLLRAVGRQFEVD